MKNNIESDFPPFGNPKSESASAQLGMNRALISWLGGSAEDPMTLFGILGDAHSTHVDAHPIFIRNAVYGTRCSTILAVGRDGAGRITERRFDKAGNGLGESAEAFNWAP